MAATSSTPPVRHMVAHVPHPAMNTRSYPSSPFNTASMGFARVMDFMTAPFPDGYCSRSHRRQRFASSRAWSSENPISISSKLLTLFLGCPRA